MSVSVLTSPGTQMETAVLILRNPFGVTAMPLFFLKLKRGSEDLPNDPEPQAFTDLAAARIEAIQALREMSAPATYDGIEITNTDGSVLLMVSTREALN